MKNCERKEGFAGSDFNDRQGENLQAQFPFNSHLYI